MSQSFRFRCLAMYRKLMVGKGLGYGRIDYIRVAYNGVDYVRLDYARAS